MDVKAMDIPSVINNFFRASDSNDKDLLSRCFAEDAVLYDVGDEFRGHREIADHIIEANITFQAKENRIDRTVSKGDEIIVAATLYGNFEGSPCPLDHHFILEENLITQLKIVLADEVK
jgi:ketosteroid isomerase-like protein